MKVDKLFRVDGSYVFNAMQPLDLLFAIKEINKIQKEKISQLGPGFAI
ncbi:MAG TPA: hypothetical protein VLU95_03320 [Candidatus Acidoferrum sp.]|nr:hypothetical protein [Candidatus Acidoferrum sp.]